MIAVPSLFDATAQDGYNRLLVVNPTCPVVLRQASARHNERLLGAGCIAWVFWYLNDTSVLNSRFMLQNLKQWALA